MKSSAKLSFALAIFIIAVLFRVAGLENRPMHTDEAVHAIKFGDLLSHHHYRYDPRDYHGPTLNYFTLIPALIQGAGSLKEVNESTLRSVPVFFGLLLLGLLFRAKHDLGDTTTLFAALFTAVSPALVFYSRYYIQEILLVCFTFGGMVFVWQYVKRPLPGRATLAGIFFGLMFASKETAILAAAAICMAVLITLLRNRKPLSRIPISPLHLFLFIASGVLISGLFYSSFLTHPSGILDSFLSYKYYFLKAGEQRIHVHPWYYYFRLLLFSPSGNGHFWSEGFPFLLALYGIGRELLRRKIAEDPQNFPEVVAWYTVLMAILYSAIPYKTPWSMLGFYQGVIVLAGVGASRVIQAASKPGIRIILAFLLITGVAHLGWESYQLNFTHFDDPGNPYVYAHPGEDVVDISRRLERIGETNPDGYDIYIQVICPDNDYWPLPWYLRKFNHVGWWSQVDSSVEAAPIILASPALEQELTARLYEVPPPGERPLYVPLFNEYKELRPGVEIRGYVRADLWQRLQSNQAMEQRNE